MSNLPTSSHVPNAAKKAELAHRPESGAHVLNHAVSRLQGRNPHESGRVSSPLELLFDLTFAVAFSTAGHELAGLIAAGHLGLGLLGYGFACFAIIWAWINFTWFASAFDTDDWLFRLTTMVQMAGAIVLAIGLGPMFASLEGHGQLDNRVMVIGYVIMRTAMLVQWVRAWFGCPDRRRGIKMYVATLIFAQSGWVVLTFTHLDRGPYIACSAVLMLIEISGPFLGERLSPTPWHAHHIAERYGLLAIIALGEGVIGTVTTLSTALGESGTRWSFEAVLLVIAGLGITFALWWVYFGVPFGALLHAYRNRAFGFGYLHIPLFAAIVAVGSGLRVNSMYISGEAKIGETGAIAAIAVPTAIFVLGVYALYFYMARQIDATHVAELLIGVCALTAAMICAHAGVGIGWCLVLVALAPAIIAIGYELIGHRYVAQALAGVLRPSASGDKASVGTSSDS